MIVAYVAAGILGAIALLCLVATLCAPADLENMDTERL